METIYLFISLKKTTITKLVGSPHISVMKIHFVSLLRYAFISGKESSGLFSGARNFSFKVHL